jgi:hypothetical protein
MHGHLPNLHQLPRRRLSAEHNAPLVRGLPVNAAEGLAQALNENGYLREGLVALVASDEPSGEAL